MYQDYLSRYFDLITEAKSKQDNKKDGDDITKQKLHKWARKKGKKFYSEFKDASPKSQKRMFRKENKAKLNESTPFTKQHDIENEKLWGSIEEGIKKDLPHGISVPFSQDALLEWARLLFDHDMTVPTTKGEWEEFLWNTMDLALNEGKSIFESSDFSKIKK